MFSRLEANYSYHFFTIFCLQIKKPLLLKWFFIVTNYSDTNLRVVFFIPDLMFSSSFLKQSIQQPILQETV